MKLKQLSCFAAGLLVGIATLTAKPVLVNGGRDLKHLAKIENKLNEGGAEIDLTVATRNGRWPLGYLEMEQAGKFTNPALCAAWYSERHQPGTGVYTVSDEIMLVGAEDIYDGVSGVIGWLDSESGIGISFTLNHYDGFQVGTVSFLTDDPGTNRSLDGLFDLDGSPARATVDSALSGKGSYDGSKFNRPSTTGHWIRMELAFSAPTEEDKSALQDVTARIKATVFSRGTKIVEGTREIVLLTNLPMPEGSKHRFGYFGYWDSLWDEGNKVGLYKNLKFDGKLYNTPPTIEPIDDLTINENGTGEVVVLIDDIELGSSQLEMSAESSNPALLPVEGIDIDPYGSQRTLTITPSANAHGEAVITISVSDGVDQDSTAFTLTVNEVNDPTILSLARGGNGELTVEWVGGGVLQSSTDLKSWQIVEGAASPFPADPVEASKYFRVILE